MIICTKEEPLRPNGYLYAVDEATGRIVLSKFANSHLNRYYFLFKFNPSHGKQKDQFAEPIAQLLEAIAQETALPATWVAAWDDASGDLHTPIRSKVAASQRRKQGYSIFVEPEAEPKPQLSLVTKPTLSVATKAADTFRGLDGKPFDCYGIFNGQFLVLGKPPALETFVSGNIRATMDTLASRRKLSPSEKFLTLIEDRKLSLIYQEYDIYENGYFVLIVVAPHKLNLDGLLENNLVDEVRTEYLF